METGADSITGVTRRSVFTAVFAPTLVATIGGRVLSFWLPDWSAMGLAYAVCFAVGSYWALRRGQSQSARFLSVIDGFLVGAVVAALLVAFR